MLWFCIQFKIMAGKDFNIMTLRDTAKSDIARGASLALGLVLVLVRNTYRFTPL